MAAATKASPMPVLPLVGSIRVAPGFKSPLASRAAIMDTPIRSFTLEVGLKNSSLASTVATGFSSAVRLGRRTSGVSPMVSMMLS